MPVEEWHRCVDWIPNSKNWGWIMAKRRHVSHCTNKTGRGIVFNRLLGRTAQIVEGGGEESDEGEWQIGRHSPNGQRSNFVYQWIRFLKNGWIFMILLRPDQTAGRKLDKIKRDLDDGKEKLEQRPLVAVLLDIHTDVKEAWKFVCSDGCIVWNRCVKVA